MKFTLLAAALLAASGVAAAFWSHAELRRARIEAQQATTQKNELQRQLASLQDPEAGQLAARFAALQAQGFFAEPDTRALAAHFQPAQKNISALPVLQTPQMLADGLLRQNRVDIELDVPHEQKFVDFWHTLDGSLPLQVTSCHLERAAQNLQARCQTQWLTAALPENAPENTR